MGRRRDHQTRPVTFELVEDDGEWDDDALGDAGYPAPGYTGTGEAPRGASRRPGPSAAAQATAIPLEEQAAHDEQAGHGPSRRRPRRRTVALVSVIVLLVAGLGTWHTVMENARVERVVAAGGLRPMSGPPEVSWRVLTSRDVPDVGATSSPVVIDDVLITFGGAAVAASGGGVDLDSAASRIAGYDVDDGHLLWEHGSGEPQVCSGVGPTAQDGPLYCYTYAEPPDPASSDGTFASYAAWLRPPVRFDVIDPRTGERIAGRDLPDGTQAAVGVSGTEIVRAYRDGRAAVVVMEDVSTGKARWSQKVALDDRFTDAGLAELPPGVERKAAEAALDLSAHDTISVYGQGIFATLTLDGERIDEAERGGDATLPDGRTVEFAPNESVVLGPDHEEQFRVAGHLLTPQSTDGTVPGVLVASGWDGIMTLDPSTGTMSEATDDVTGVDSTTGEVLWSTDGPVDVLLAQVGSTGVFAREGRLLALDLRTGERLWETESTPTGYDRVLTDGESLLVLRSQSDGDPVALTSISLATGRETWQAALASEPGYVLVARGTLLLVSSGSIAAFG